MSDVANSIVNRMFSQQPKLAIPFCLRGYDGTVFVKYGANVEPQRWGFRHLGLPFDITLANGFPVCQAEVDYSGEGYCAFMGWIQVVSVTDYIGQSWAAVDVAPIFSASDSPFAVFGHRPTMFDAPGPNPPRSDETWVAETFLAIVPDVARSRSLRPVLGFRWGYTLKSMRANLVDLELTGERDWQRCLATLREQYPDWDFDPRFHTD